MPKECLRPSHYFQSMQDAAYRSPVSHRHPFSWMYVIYPKALEQLNQHAPFSLKRLKEVLLRTDWLLSQCPCHMQVILKSSNIRIEALCVTDRTSFQHKAAAPAMVFKAGEAYM